MAELTERKLFLGFAIVFIMVVSAAVLAIQQARPQPVTPLDQLPLATNNYGNPSIERCQATGGTVGYDRMTECYAQPDVTDACGFGVPCFIDRNGQFCREVREPYCGCTTDAQCPTPLTCQGIDRATGQGRCRTAPSSAPPRPL